VELGSSPKGMMDSWNKFTANWLRRYVYTRVKISALKLPTTFFVSAFWHGFYPGYYTTFLSSVLMTENARVLRRSLRPFFVAGRFRFLKPVYGNDSFRVAVFIKPGLV
jgi:D-alanyl-lipoteichoic acid acyltransferase DltB (MBOAT superfamily)